MLHAQLGHTVRTEWARQRGLGNKSVLQPIDRPSRGRINNLPNTRLGGKLKELNRGREVLFHLDQRITPTRSRICRRDEVVHNLLPFKGGSQQVAIGKLPGNQPDLPLVPAQVSGGAVREAVKHRNRVPCGNSRIDKMRPKESVPTQHQNVSLFHMPTPVLMLTHLTTRLYADMAC